MRISDWSSDVCSSDLLRVVPGRDALSLPVSKHGAPRDAQRCGYLVVGLVAGRQPAHLPPTTSDVVGGVARVRLAQSHRSAAASAATCFEMQSSPALRNISRALSRVLPPPARSEERRGGKWGGRTGSVRG